MGYFKTIIIELNCLISIKKHIQKTCPHDSAAAGLPLYRIFLWQSFPPKLSFIAFY